MHYVQGYKATRLPPGLSASTSYNKIDLKQYSHFSEPATTTGNTLEMALHYEPLDVDSYEIRMLTILPGSPGSIVRCTMQKTNLISPIKYAALSYCWGDATITTDIFVNAIEIQVTVNLADALQHLRKLGVGRLWVDALCINQTDKQEKGLQIRNMKYIYSKAEMTYAWLGKEEVNGTNTVFTFLISLLHPHSNMVLAPTSHTCSLRTSAPSRRRWRLYKPLNRPAYQNPPQSGDCQRCILESSIQGLRRILECQYWKRRWIIQETSASYRQFLLCGDATITLDEMDRAVSLCRESCYWSSGVVKAFSWFEIITIFRGFYQENARPSLCQAIELSREFESTDPRDAIFSLLGICHDGPELVPTPNYSQPVERIVRDLTKALIWKHKWLDFILINGIDRVKRTGLKGLPSWAPDWLSGNLPPQAYRLADESRKRDRPRICLGDTIDRNFSLGQGKILRVQGTPIGRVATMTSTTDPSGGVSSLYPNQPIRSVPLTDSYSRSYYTETQVLTALMTCLSLNPQGRHVCFPEHFWSFWVLCDNARVTWHTFCLRCVPANSQPSHPNAESGDVGITQINSRRMLSQWLETNAAFEIRGKTLKGWIEEEHSSLAPLLRVFDSILAIPFTILLILLSWAPPLISATVLSTRYRDVFDGSSSDDIPALLYIGIGLAVVSLFVSTNGFLHFLEYRRLSRISKQRWDDWTHLVNPGKRLIVADKGFLGMVDDRAMEGDILFNLVGCPESVVLRKVEGGRKRYVVVGECYVHFIPTDQDEYFGPADKKWNPSQQQAEKVKWLNGPRKWKLEELELV